MLGLSFSLKTYVLLVVGIPEAAIAYLIGIYFASMIIN
jgi:hypothetical protein